MNIWILTLFPEYFDAFLNSGVISRFLQNENSSTKIKINIVQIRKWANNSYGSVDDYPFGGGAGLIMRFDVLSRCLIEGVFIPGGYDLDSKLKSKIPESELTNFNLNNFNNNNNNNNNKPAPLIIYPSPKGKKFDNQYAKVLAREQILQRDLVFVAGRYEGIDERFIEMFVDEEISVGDYVLSGGEIAILSILDSVIRQIPGALGNSLSIEEESFENMLLEAPQYTRPRTFLGKEVPDIYLSGHHAEMKKYRLDIAKKLTKKLRPDLYQKYLDKNGCNGDNGDNENDGDESL
ncbi:MAG: tRNA (guanosine(37)-N1)-methyltransferase TrmD [Oligoflexia bacterium]|nr:tRNA (guanosine(37)-N1)-methyltransferase TrmD [Oligoflexia bacterium]